MAETLPALSGAAAFAAARDYAADAHSAATRRAYRADWADFTAFCRAANLSPLPAAPQTVAAYFAAMAATHARSTIQRRLAAIGQAHKLAGQEWIPSHPLIRTTLRGIGRRHGSAVRRAAALTTAEIRKLVATCRDDLTGLRDRAMILLGFAGALRRSELVGINREHLVLRESGIRLTIPRSKGDQEGAGVEIGIPKGNRRETCPVRALEAWLLASDCQFGPVFRKVDLWGNIEHRRLHPDAVRQILLRRAKQAGIEVPGGERLSPHGLRAGFVTEAYLAGARDEQIMAHTRHADLKTMRGYVRRAKLVSDSPAKLLGL
ncbi:Site-specific integrase (plasmid) [Rhodovastum atsumiense]|uniref:site-specific integrase n=1 Tax=Rhodovastum atsumiense TaxID=504468 RepID=UPI002023E08D|nr:site-specific integrase [Rhodovastum atsumiense]CAH2605492.1 Site-specific integrase [Rhodovastum atsumiense]